MKPDTDVIDAPPAATPELLPHEWAPNGECTNAEKITVDFGTAKKSGLRTCTVWLGLRADGTWRWGGYFRSRIDKAATTQPCVDNSPSFPTREAALKNALGVALELFRGDADGTRAIAGFLGRLFPNDAPALAKQESAEGSAPNVPPADSRPLPPARFDPALPLKAIQRNPEQPRQDFPEKELRELADSIASVGLIEPIVVRKLGREEAGEMFDAERYELVAGERRWRAHELLKRDTIEAKIFEGLTRAQAKAAALVENLQREGLNPIEEAIGYRDLMATEGLTQEQCAQRVGKSRPVIANALRVLDLPEKVIKLIREGKLTAAHGTALARFKAWPAVVDAIAAIAAKEKSTTAELEAGLPFADELVEAGLAGKVKSEQFNYKVPPALKKHPSYFEDPDYGYVGYMLDLPVLETALEKAKAEQKAERAKQQAKEGKKAPTQKTLEDLKGSVHKLDEEQVDLALELLPDKSVSDVKKASWSSDKVTVCSHQALAKKVDEALSELRAKDRAAKIPPLIDKAITAIGKTKKLGARELALLFSFAQNECNPAFDENLAKTLGLKLPKFSREVSYSLALEDLRGFAAVDAVKFFIVLVVSRLNDEIEQDTRGRSPSERAACIKSDGNAATLIKWILEIDDFGLLEDSAVGQKQLVKTIEAQEWYQRELAKIEGREYVPPPPPLSEMPKVAKAKMKGGKAVIDDDVYSDVRKLVEAGYDSAQIAKAIGISLPSVQNCKKRLGFIK
jgi:ParB family chromosome partitioning protein